MDAAQRSELAELRRRAYGPGAGLGAEELDRLHALQVQEAAAPVISRDADPSRVEDPAHAPDPPVDLADGPADAAAPVAPRSRVRRLTGILWAASVLVAIALTALVTSTLDQAPGREVAVLRLDPNRPLPQYMDDFFGGSEAGSAGYHGLTIVRLVNEQSSFPDGSTECLSIQATAEAPTSSFGGSCSAGGFGPSARMLVNFGAPDALRDEHPVGTALLFELDGDSVRVRADEPGPQIALAR